MEVMDCVCKKGEAGRKLEKMEECPLQRRFQRKSQRLKTTDQLVQKTGGMKWLFWFLLIF